MSDVYGTGAAILGSGAAQPGPQRDEDGLAEARRTNRPVSLGQAARLYRKSTHTLRAAIKASELAAHRVGTRRYEVYPADMDAWIRGAKVETARERAVRLVKRRA